MGLSSNPFKVRHQGGKKENLLHFQWMQLGEVNTGEKGHMDLFLHWQMLLSVRLYVHIYGNVNDEVDSELQWKFWVHLVPLKAERDNKAFSFLQYYWMAANDEAHFKAENREESLSNCVHVTCHYCIFKDALFALREKIKYVPLETKHKSIHDSNQI